MMKKIILFLVALSVTASLFSACEKKSETLLTEDNVGGQRGNQFEQQARNMKIGKITKLSGNKAEILVAKMPERSEFSGERQNGNQGGQQGNRPQGDGARPQGDGTRPQGGMMMRNPEFTDEKIEITISEDVKIMSAGRDSQQLIEISDLKIDDIISYSEEDGKITSVRLMNIPAEQ